MAQITLNAGESFTVAGGTNVITGRIGSGETVIVNAGKQTFDADFNTGGDTIVLAGNSTDYTAVRSGSTIILTGSNGVTVSFPAPNPDLAAGDLPVIQFADETFTLSSSITGGFTVSLAPADGVGTTFVIPTTATAIPDVDAGTPPGPVGPTVNVTATDVTEGGQITYTFTLSAAQAAAVTLNIATVGGTATPGVDFTPVSTQVTFAAGQTVQFLTVNTVNDALPEPTETVAITVGLPAGFALAAGADLVAEISDDDGDVPTSYFLSTGNDTANGGSADDRFVGSQDITQPGKLLSVNDVINGGGGTDSLELTNAPGGVPQVLSDIDFTNVTSIERLVTNYQSIQLGVQADKAGIVTIDTQSRIDSANSAGVVFGGVLLDLTLDQNGDSLPDFNNALNVTMANSVGDTVLLNFASAVGSNFNTGTTFAFAGGGGLIAEVDAVIFADQTDAITLTFDGSKIGNGSATGTGGALAIQATSAAAAGAIGIDDEGTYIDSMTGGTVFNVVDTDGTAVGSFGSVLLGTQLDDSLFAGTSGYVNGGAGDDFIDGSSDDDHLIGGAGNDEIYGYDGKDTLLGGDGDDYLDGGNDADTVLGGAGNDTIIGGAGVDTLDGGEGSDTYYYDDGEFVAGEALHDSGTGASDVDLIEIHSHSDITDAMFANKSGIEVLSTDTHGGNTITVGTNAQAAGITEFVSREDTLDASAYTADINVLGYGNIKTGSGADVVSLQGSTDFVNQLGGSVSAPFVLFAGSVNLGDGDDTLNTGFAISGGSNHVLTGGDGFDTIAFGAIAGTKPGDAGNIALGSAAIYTDPFGSNMKGFERVLINASSVGTAIGYDLTVVDGNVAAGSSLIIDGSALKADAVVDGGDGIIGSADDFTFDEVLTVDGSALTAGHAITVIGGAANDQLTGGAGDDTLRGGLGDDILQGGLGTDTMDGGAGSDTYVFANGELTAADIVLDTGSGGIDTMDVTSATAITDALFANKSGVEALTTNVTTGTAGDMTAAGVGAEVTIGAKAQAAGIVTVTTDDDDLYAADYTVGLTVNTETGAVITGSGNDVVNLADDMNGLYFGRVQLGAGDDTVNAHWAYNAPGMTMDGGTGTDSFVFGGALVPLGLARGQNLIGASAAFGTGFTNFEKVVLNGGERAEAVAGGPDLAGSTLLFNVSLHNANVTVGTPFTVDASGLTKTAVALGADGELGGTGANADTIVADTLRFDGSGLTGGRQVIVLGGEGNDTLVGGAGADTLDGGAGNDTITGGDGFDIIRGGAGDDRIILTVPQFNSDADQIDGGAGNDTLQISGTLAAQEIADVGFNGRFTSIEEVTLVGAGGGTAFTYQAGFYSESTGVKIINLGANTSGSTVSIANYATGGATINGGAGNDTMIGSQFADVFTTGGGNDTINAGGGADVLTLGTLAGNTTFRGEAGNDTVNAGAQLDGADILDGGSGVDTLNVGVANAAYSGQTINLTATVVAGLATSGIYAFETVNLAAGLAPVDNPGATPDVLGVVNHYSVNVDDSTFAAATGTITIDGSALRSGVVTGFGGDGLMGGGDDVTSTDTMIVNGSLITTAGHVLNIIGGAGSDFLIGGAGNDIINGGAGNDTLVGGAGNDVITGGAGSDFIVGGIGVDTIHLGVDGVEDYVVINDGDAPRAPAGGGIETITGFEIDSDDVAGLNANADVIDFGSGIIATTSGSISNGMVQAGSTLGDAINSSTSLLAAIQLVEQEFHSGTDAAANNGVVAFTYGGNTYIGEVTGVQGFEAFTDIVQLTGVSGATQLVMDGGAVGLSV
jgi:Ca2+-binding RTX toxin-like protein